LDLYFGLRLLLLHFVDAYCVKCDLTVSKHAVGFDGGAGDSRQEMDLRTEFDTQKGIDSLIGSDAQKVDILRPDTLLLADSGVAVDTKSVVDTKPQPDLETCPSITTQKPADPYNTTALWSVTVHATSPDGFCFKTCDTPIFSVAWTNFDGRTVTVNGKPFQLVSPLCLQTVAGCGSTGVIEGATFPGGELTFRVSAGQSTAATFLWTGGSKECLKN
jgi:hypothetical protein